jgi:hypothetical protein
MNRYLRAIHHMDMFVAFVPTVHVLRVRQLFLPTFGQTILAANDEDSE